jgi:hypothetical protein
LTRFSWFSFSSIKVIEGIFCRVCVIFGPRSAGCGDQQLRALVTVPFIRWKDAIEKFQSHQNTDYHKRAYGMADNFKEFINSPDIDVCKQLNSERRRQAVENRARLIPTLKTKVFCAHQELSFHGRREESGTLKLATEQREGNFRAALRFRLEAGDYTLLKHLQTAGNNFMYISPSIQNELIAIMGCQIQNKIVAQVKEAKVFAILADETTDISSCEQLSISLR